MGLSVEQIIEKQKLGKVLSSKLCFLPTHNYCVIALSYWLKVPEQCAEGDVDGAG